MVAKEFYIEFSNFMFPFYTLSVRVDNKFVSFFSVIVSLVKL